MRSTGLLWVLLAVVGAAMAQTEATVGAIATNPLTKKIYVAHKGDSEISIVDGKTNETTIVKTEAPAVGLAINSITNRVYAASALGVTVIDGATSTTTAINAGSHPSAITVNEVTNRIYVADWVDNAVTVIEGATNQTTTIPVGRSPVALEVNANTNKVYVANFQGSSLTVIDGATNNTSVLELPKMSPQALAVDAGTGKVYVVALGHLSGNSLVTIDPASDSRHSIPLGPGPRQIVLDPGAHVLYINDVLDNTVTVVDEATYDAYKIQVGSHPYAMALNPAAGELYVANYGAGTISVIDTASRVLKQTVAAGSDPVAITVNPATGRLYVPGHREVAASLTPRTSGLSLAVSSSLEGPAAGSDSVIVTGTGSWTAVANDPWLHTTASGTGNGLAIFTYDGNTGATRTGTLTIAGQTFTVTQAASGYASASYVTLSSAGNVPYGVAADSSCNAYYADSGNAAIKKWTASSQTVSTLISSGLQSPLGVAVGGSGDLYIADSGLNAVLKWNASNQQLTTLVSGLDKPDSVALDSAGNLYFESGGKILKWTASNSQVTTLISSSLSAPEGVAVDLFGNVYIADYNLGLLEWTASTGQLSTLIAAGSSGLNTAKGVAVDGTGNVYVSDGDKNNLLVWSPSTTTVSAPAIYTVTANYGVAVDSCGDVFLTDADYNLLLDLPIAYLPTAVSVPAGSGTSSVAVIPATTRLTGPFAPVYNTPTFLASQSASNGSVNFSYSANTSTNSRSATITLFNKTVTVTQAGLQTQTITFGALSDQPLGTAPFTVSATASSGLAVSLASTTMNVCTVSGSTVTLLTTGTCTIKANQPGDANYEAAPTVSRSFTVKQPAPAATSLNKTAGDSQSVVIGAPFPTNLKVTLLDQYSNPFPGAQVTFTINAGAGGASGTFALTPTQPVTTGSDGTATAPVLTANATAGAFTVTATVASTSLTQTFNLTNIAQTVTLGSSTSLEGPSAGGDTIQILANTGWTASSNSPWLHTTASGSGNGLAIFTYDANTGTARTGTLTIAGQTFTVTQAGANYVSSSYIQIASWKTPFGVATDSSCNAYVADPGNSTIEKWTSSTQSQSTLISSGLKSPGGVAVDTAGNLYISDTQLGKVLKWDASTQQLTPLITSGLGQPGRLAVDPAGNLYIPDANQIMKWTASSGQLTALVSSGLSAPEAVALDAAGNLFIADYNKGILEWNISTAQLSTLVAQGTSGTGNPEALALDPAGNIYVGDINGFGVPWRWSPSTNQIAKIHPGDLWSSFGYYGIAVSPCGDVFVPTYTDLWDVPLAYYEGSVNVPATAGNGSANVLPSTLRFSGSLGPSSSGFITLQGVSSQSVNFSYPANTSTQSRTAKINFTNGNSMTVTQAGVTPVPATLNKTAGDNQSVVVGLGNSFSNLQVTLLDQSGYAIAGAQVTFTIQPGSGGASGTFAASPTQPIATDANGNAIAPTLTGNNLPGTFTVIATVGATNLTQTFTLTNAAQSFSFAERSLVVGPAAGSNSVAVVANAPWTIASNASWLHSTASGSGNAIAVFTFDANSGPARSGMLTIGSQTFTLTQVGSQYTAASLTTLLPPGAGSWQGGAMDSSGNFYFVDVANSAIVKWSPSTQQISTVISGLSQPSGVALDAAGNIYFGAGTVVNVWNASTQQISRVYSPGITVTENAVDTAGNVFTIGSDPLIHDWFASSGSFGIVPGSSRLKPIAIAIDAVGHFYAAATATGTYNDMLCRAPLSGLITPLASIPDIGYGLAADGGGNVYVTTASSPSLWIWNDSTQQTQQIQLPGVSGTLAGVAVDPYGNVYLTANGIYELPNAYVPSATISEGSGAGSDSLAILPSTQSLTGVFAPSSDQTWLTLGTASNGVIAFSFTANTSSSARTAHITVLGVSVAVQQAGAASPDFSTSTLIDSGNGAFAQGDQGRTFTITVTNKTGVATTSGTITAAITPTSGLLNAAAAGSGWNCTGLTCTNASVLAAGSNLGALTVTVNVDPNAASSQTLTAVISGGGAAASTTLTDNITITQLPHLAIQKMHTGSFYVNDAAGTDSFTLTVTNAGTVAATTAKITDTFDSHFVLGTLPSGCVANGQAVTCTPSSIAANNGTAGFTIPVTMVSGTSGSVSNSGTVSCTPTSSCIITTASANDSVIVSAGPVLTLQLSDDGSPAHTYSQGDTGKTITGSLTTSASTSGTVTVSFTLPTGLTPASLNGPGGWTCGTTSCSTTGSIATGPALTFTLKFSVSSSLAAGQVTVNAQASGGNTVSSSPSDTLTINQTPSQANSSITGGNNQSVAVSTAFGSPLAVVIKDGAGNPINGASVTFTVPGSASATVTSPQSTNSSGVASTSATANGLAGAYTVTASVGGVSLTFNLTNTATPTVTPSANPSTVTYSANTQSLPLSATVSGGSAGAVNSGSITYTITDPSSNQSTVGPVSVSSGAAASANFTVPANPALGTWSISAAFTNGGVFQNAMGTGSFSVTAGQPGHLSAYAGSGQSATVATQFGAALQAKVTDASNNPVPGVSVMFTAPSGSFSNNQTSFTVMTNSSGIASATYTAGTNAGAYSVTAAVSGLTSVNFSLTNNAGAPYGIAAQSGGGQSTTTSAPFTNPLVGKVADQYGNPVSGVSVTFAGPTGTGASATFTNATVSTNASGLASGSATANGTAGTYNVTASVGGVQQPATFSLTNNAATVQVTLQTSPTGLQVSADGGTTFFAAPHAFTLNVNSTPIIVATTPQTLSNTQYVFQTWSDSGAASHSITVPASNTTLTATFKISQTVTFGSLGNQIYGAAPFTVSASATSGLAVTFASLTNSVCTVAGNTVGLIAAGTCTIQASQVGNSSYAAAPSVSQGFQVLQASQTIIFGSISDQVLGTGPVAIMASADSTLPVSFTSQTPTVCSVSGASVTLVSIGRCTIQASQSGNTNYLSATPVTQNLQIVANVSSQVKVTTSGLVLNHATEIWSETLSIANTGQTTISGPIEVVLTNLATNATLNNASGTFGGNPYITVVASSGSLVSGASASMTLQFKNLSNGGITFTPVTYSGAF